MVLDDVRSETRFMTLCLYLWCVGDGSPWVGFSPQTVPPSVDVSPR